MCSVEKQFLPTNYTKHFIDKTNDTSLCRMCGDKGEKINHIWRASVPDWYKENIKGDMAM